MSINKKVEKINSKPKLQKLSFKQALKVSEKLEKKGFVLTPKDQKEIISDVSASISSK